MLKLFAILKKHNEVRVFFHLKERNHRYREYITYHSKTYKAEHLLQTIHAAKNTAHICANFIVSNVTHLFVTIVVPLESTKLIMCQTFLALLKEKRKLFKKI